MAVQPLTSLFLDLNSFFASVEQQRDPSLRGKPVAVVPVETDATCAIAASYEAKAYGIKTGTAIWEAKKRCPEIICVLANHQHYVECHHRIVAEIDKHLPVKEVASIDEFGCELQGKEREHEEAIKIAHAIKGSIARNVGEHIRSSIGISTNMYLAKVATDLEKPNGLVVLHPDDMPGRLEHCSLTDLPGIGRNMARRLRIRGVGDIPDLWSKSPKEMRALWGGIEGERYWYKLHGIEIPRHETERRTIGHSHVLEPKMRPPGQAFTVAQRLLQKATARMRRMDYASSHLVISIRIENGPHLEAESHFRAAFDTAFFMQQLLPLWKVLMEAAGKVLIKKVSVSLYGLVPQSQLQDDLFDWADNRTQQGRAEKARAVSKAMDMINHRFGRDSVVQGFIPKESRTFSGTKIAFTRIPDLKEFLE